MSYSSPVSVIVKLIEQKIHFLFFPPLTFHTHLQEVKLFYIMAFAAETSRIDGKVVDMEAYRKQLAL
ncbi:MAG: hypothetical protein ACTSRC_08470 [Candidatus Helarchaeota archaeon]